MLEKFPDAWDCIDVNLTVSSFLNLLRNAYPGEVIYQELIKFVSKLPHTLFEPQFVENLFNCIFKGLKSEEAIGFCDKLIGAYYECLLHVSLKVINDPELIGKLYLNPVEIYLGNIEVFAKSVYHPIPKVLTSALAFLGSRNLTVPIWDSLSNLLNKYLLEQHHFSAVELLRVMCEKLSFGQYEIAGQLRAIVDNLYALLSYDIENLINEEAPNILDKLKLYTRFSTKLGNYVPKTARVSLWWKKVCEGASADKM
jgi:hypothetical protein